ncbi:MAG: tyrosine-type recombinase/integrase [Caulobacteraceae bacterium]
MSEYWYAWRGGPQILKASATSDALLDREIARRTLAAMAAFEGLKTPTSGKFLYALITRYLGSGEYEGLAPRTQKDRRKFLDQIRTGPLGEMELSAFEAKGARTLLLRWRDGFSEHPKTADELMGALQIVLQWGLDRGEVNTNPIAGFPRLYHSNRAEQIWEAPHLAALYPHCAEELNHAVRLAILTGQRLGDLIKLPWTAVGHHAINWQTGKSRGRRTVVIPITDELRSLLKEIPRRASTTILTSGRERPWTESGLASAFRRAKIDAFELLQDKGLGLDVRPLRFHDLRGTAATTFIRAGLSLDDVATILGWEKVRVEQIAARYVTAEAIGLAMVERLRKADARTPQQRKL